MVEQEIRVLNMAARFSKFAVGGVKRARIFSAIVGVFFGVLFLDCLAYRFDILGILSGDHYLARELGSGLTT